jgi:hypothetical protein
VVRTLQKTAADIGKKQWSRQLTFLKGKFEEYCESTSSERRRNCSLQYTRQDTRLREMRYSTQNKCTYVNEKEKLFLQFTDSMHFEAYGKA